jgi:spore germination protein KC
MQKILIIPLLICLILNTGCQSMGNLFADRYEIDKMDFVRGIGIDFIDSKFILSVFLERAAKKKKQHAAIQGTSEGEVLYTEGKSVVEAVKKLDKFSDKHIFLGHLSFIIIGEEAAKTDMIRTLDFLSRNNQIRITSDIFIAKNINALDLLDKASSFDKFIGDKLRNLTENDWAEFLISNANLLSILEKMDNETIGYTIPCITIANNIIIKDGKNETNISMDGYAVFKNNRLLTYTNDYETELGINIINNKVSAGDIVVNILNDVTVTLDILNMDTKVKTSFNDLKPSVNIETNVSLNIGELSKPVDIFNTQDFDEIDRAQAANIKKYINKAIKFAQDNNVDIFSFSETIHRQHPYKWEDLENKWAEIFPTIPYAVNIKSQIKRTYNIKQTQGTKVKE